MPFRLVRVTSLPVFPATLPQTREQERVEARIKDLAERLAPVHGMDRRRFLASTAGMAAAFLAMNEVFGPVFDVSRAEAQTPGVADRRADGLAGQFIFDDQVHFVRDAFTTAGLRDPAKYGRQNWNPALAGDNNLARYKFENFVKEIYVDSDTKVALLSGAPFDDPTWDLLTNDQIAAARAAINRISGSRRLLGHAVITPNKGPWMAEVDRCIAQVRPDSWKGYTVGDPLSPSKLGSFWRLDDEKLMYPFYEKAVKAGITTICIHKGLLPADYQKSWAQAWQYNTVWDVGKAAKDWPQMNFVIYHSALRLFLEPPDAMLAEFRKSGRLDWVTTSQRSQQSSASTTSTGRSARPSRPVRCRARPSPLPSWAPSSGASAPTTWPGAPTRCGMARPSGRSRPSAASRSPSKCRRTTSSRPSAPPTGWSSR